MEIVWMFLLMAVMIFVRILLAVVDYLPEFMREWNELMDDLFPRRRRRRSSYRRGPALLSFNNPQPYAEDEAPAFIPPVEDPPPYDPHQDPRLHYRQNAHPEIDVWSNPYDNLSRWNE
ncbi:hypothetical protein [Meiothermus granaticius]|nr:hypothetical protein [Meiothermus granaticius]GEM88351.1 hypothetical protein MGR01S_29760 [Meiothermus granaticius NBRC 107808]